jgi:hypothetical protein
MDGGLTKKLLNALGPPTTFIGSAELSWSEATEDASSGKGERKGEGRHVERKTRSDRR